MTTIAYRNGAIACDSCWAHNKVQTTSHTKIRRLSSGALLGMAGDGDVREIIALIDKCKTPEALPFRMAFVPFKIAFEFLIIFPKGQVWMIASKQGGDNDDDRDHFEVDIWPVNRGLIAIGSGAELAIGAMAAGASAARAVKIACDWDTGSRGPTHTLSLIEIKKSKTAAPGVSNAAPRSKARVTPKKTRSKA